MLDSIFQDQDPDCWGAFDFLDAHMQPITKVVVIESCGMAQPPGGGTERVYFIFKGDRRKAFLKTSARREIAMKLKTQVPKDLIGVALKMTAIMAKNPKASSKRPEIPKEVLSMHVLDACYPKSRQQQPAQQSAPETPPAQQPPPKEPEKPRTRDPGED